MTPIADQQPKEQMLELHELEHDTATQSRVAIDPETVERYGELMRSGVKFDPITVFYDGVRYWVADGWHRASGAQWASKKSILCLIYKGTKEDAILASCSANARHGKAMTSADKRKCIETVLKMRPDWSDRAIADHVGCGHQLVGSVRRQVDESSTSGGPSLAEQYEKRVGRDGKNYPPSQPAKENPVERADRLAQQGVDEARDALDEEDPMIELIGEPYREALRYLDRASALMREEAEDPQRPYLQDTITRITTDIQHVRAAIRAVEPVESCEPCLGQGCGRCRYSGYLSRGIVNQRAED